MVAIEREVQQPKFEAAVAHARAQAAASGGLRGVVRGSFAAAVSEEVAEFAQMVLTDGTYARAVDQIGQLDPDLANI